MRQTCVFYVQYCFLIIPFVGCGISLLICRYALDVNVERAEDVLMHKRLLDLAEDPVHRPAFEVHLVQVMCKSHWIYFIVNPSTFFSYIN